MSSSQSVSRAIVFFSRSLPPPFPPGRPSAELSSSFLSCSPLLLDDDDDDDHTKDHDDLTKDWRPLCLSVELLSSLLALSPFLPLSGRLSAELSSPFLACFPFSRSFVGPSNEGRVCVYTLILS